MFGRLFVALALLFVSSRFEIAQAIDPLVSTRASNYLIARVDRSPGGNILAGNRLEAEPLRKSVDRLRPLPTAAIETIREVYVWAWPLVYMHNLKESLRLVRSPGVSGGAPVAPINSLCMLSDVVSSNFRSVPCPNGDVIYGFGLMDLADQPVVIQVPDFGDAFWMYQLGDHRMESFGQLGSLYGTEPGFYLVVGPQWQGDAPANIRAVLRSPTNLAYVLPRVLSPKELANDQRSNQLSATLGQIAMYPLSKFSGAVQRKDWSRVRWYPAIGHSTRERSKLVSPTEFFEDLEAVINDLPSLPGEEALHELAEQLIQRGKEDPEWKTHLQQLAMELESQTIAPMFDFAKSGQLLPGNWHTLVNGASFGNEYWTRTAVAKSNPFVNRPQEAKYYYLDQDAIGQRLEGSHTYTLTFPADELPPANGFWSLTLYNSNHQFHENEAQKYSLGSWSQELKRNADGSLSIVIASEPSDAAASANWLPAPRAEQFSLYLRVYAPGAAALDGSWIPPAIQ